MRREPKPKALELIEKRTDSRNNPKSFGINQNPKCPGDAKLQSSGNLASERVIKNANGSGVSKAKASTSLSPGPRSVTRGSAMELEGRRIVIQSSICRSGKFRPNLRPVSSSSWTAGGTVIVLTSSGRTCRAPD